MAINPEIRSVCGARCADFDLHTQAKTVFTHKEVLNNGTGILLHGGSSESRAIHYMVVGGWEGGGVCP